MLGYGKQYLSISDERQLFIKIDVRAKTNDQVTNSRE